MRRTTGRKPITGPQPPLPEPEPVPLPGEPLPPETPPSPHPRPPQPLPEVVIARTLSAPKPSRYNYVHSGGGALAVAGSRRFSRYLRPAEEPGTQLAFRMMKWSRQSLWIEPMSPLGVRILPPTPRRSEHHFHPERGNPRANIIAVHLIAVANQMTARIAMGERLDNLLGGPVRGGMLGQMEMQHLTTPMLQHHENEHYPQAHRRHGKKSIETIVLMFLRKVPTNLPWARGISLWCFAI